MEVTEGRQLYLLRERVRNQAFSERSVELKINKHRLQAVCNYCAIALHATLLTNRRLKIRKAVNNIVTLTHLVQEKHLNQNLTHSFDQRNTGT